MFTDGIAQYIGSVVEGLAYSEAGPDGNVFVDRIPDRPDRAVAVYVSPGTEADSRLPYDPVQFQVLARSEADGVWARAMWEAVRDELHALRNVVLPDGTSLVYVISTQASPFRLGDDVNGRPSYVGNYRAEIMRTTAARP